MTNKQMIKLQWDTAQLLKIMSQIFCSLTWKNVYNVLFKKKSRFKKIKHIQYDLIKKKKKETKSLYQNVNSDSLRLMGLWLNLCVCTFDVYDIFFFPMAKDITYADS